MPIVKQCAHCSKSFEYQKPGQRFCGDECRFWAKVDKNGPVPSHCPERGPCWLWTAGLDTHGYGQVYWNSRIVLATHVVLELAGRPRAAGTYALHHCDNSRCVAAQHLYWGTPTENNIDALVRGRNMPRMGSGHGSSKLTDAQVIEIRTKHSHRPRADVAAEFGVTPAQVGHIVRRRVWRHI